MIRRRTIGIAAATTLLAGLGTYGATAAFATTSGPGPQVTSPASPSAQNGREGVIRHCTDQLPAGERATAPGHRRRSWSPSSSSPVRRLRRGFHLGRGQEGHEPAPATPDHRRARGGPLRLRAGMYGRAAARR
ncbi:hypothetical protein SCATT_27300 [Streptantibioticus cattleyicolor NRRL 8057 = DSM 46488]|uniref:Uncharacterized protein n=1 Tax=Streptantibioticus cattleyicolor (strain ATCC 35852 / DSM 46488 / JCM 4925 / NBRC 14057 / NRRL 8057) TaxID=1003195 RepID=G8X2I5_STREN|nr:hypothetical protein SCATT_27300 [Streptantibioticus cattleyicolor NRRL 8057 = DSM 46488]